MKAWSRFVLNRFVGLIGVLAAMVFVLFLLRQVVPVDPARAAVGPNAPNAVVEAKRVELGLDRSIPVQFGRYLGDLSRGDLGTSVVTKNPVREDIAKALPATAELILASLVLAVVIGVVAAVLQSLLRAPGVVRWPLLVVASVPSYLLALGGLYFLWFKFGWLPSGSRADRFDLPDGPTGFLTLDAAVRGDGSLFVDAVRHLVMPATVLALPMAVAVARSMGSSLVDVLRSDYARTARSKGLSRRTVIMRHGLRNSAVSSLALGGLYFGLLLTNMLLVEQIFAWPGLGLYTSRAIGGSDLSAILGVALVLGAAYILVNALVEVGQVASDPRLRPN